MRVSANISIYVVDDNGRPFTAGGTLNYNRSGQVSAKNFQEIAVKLDKIDAAISEIIDQEPML